MHLTTSKLYPLPWIRFTILKRANKTSNAPGIVTYKGGERCSITGSGAGAIPCSYSSSYSCSYSCARRRPKVVCCCSLCLPLLHLLAPSCKYGTWPAGGCRHGKCHVAVLAVISCIPELTVNQRFLTKVTTEDQSRSW